VARLRFPRCWYADLSRLRIWRHGRTVKHSSSASLQHLLGGKQVFKDRGNVIIVVPPRVQVLDPAATRDAVLGPGRRTRMYSAQNGFRLSQAAPRFKRGRREPEGIIDEQLCNRISPNLQYLPSSSSPWFPCFLLLSNSVSVLAPYIPLLTRRVGQRRKKGWGGGREQIRGK
jgi:hypothetical protein